MNIVSDLQQVLQPAGLDVEAVVYTGSAESYVVITPQEERNDDIADDAPLTETDSADVNLYFVGNYQAKKNQLVSLLRGAGFFIADRRFVEYIPDRKQNHYVISVEKKEVL